MQRSSSCSLLLHVQELQPLQTDFIFDELKKKAFPALYTVFPVVAEESARCLLCNVRHFVTEVETKKK